jgi:cell wall-associated NlpC family hydrolase
VAAVTSLVAVAAPATAGANQLGNARAAAIALNAKIQALGYREAALSESYDAERANVAAARAKVATATRKLRAAEAAQVRTMALLQQDAVQAYVGGGPQAGLGSVVPTSNVAEAMLGQEMAQTFASDQTDALDGYRAAAANEVTARAQLVVARNADVRQLARLATARNQVQAAQDRLIATEARVKGQIATILAQIRQQQLIAAERAAAARLARERAAEAAAAAAAARQAALARARAAQVAAEHLAAARLAADLAAAKRAAGRREAALRASAAVEAPANAPAVTSSANLAGNTASAVTPPVATVPTTAPAPQIPGVSPAASIAVQAALSRVGDPYVWGASGPGAFDCSGLVMWAYAQAGVSLPHFSGAQYAMTTHIPMADLQPGDLVFPADPGQHVAMYIGNGEIVQAPYTGADVQVVPMSSFFVLASRVG